MVDMEIPKLDKRLCSQSLWEGVVERIVDLEDIIEELEFLHKDAKIQLETMKALADFLWEDMNGVENR